MYIEVSTNFLTLVPLIMGLVAVFRRAGVTARYLPLLALLFGVLGTWVVSGQTDWISGLVLGLTASGLYSGTKSVVRN